MNRKRFHWKDRERDLRGVKRYGKFPVMFYRTDLSIHSRRVELLLESFIALAEKLYPGFDARKARLIARHHDDYELQPIGDIPLQLKLQMGEEQLSELENREIQAAEEMARSYPRTVGEYRYLELLLHAIRKDCKEAQLVSVADKFDGLCEALHEVLAGNIIFVEAVINYFTKTLCTMSDRYPLIGGMFSNGHELLSVPVVGLYEYFEAGARCAQPHTEMNVTRKTGIPVYETWKLLTKTKIGIEPLICQTEFYEPDLSEVQV